MVSFIQFYLCPPLNATGAFDWRPKKTLPVTVKVRVQV